MKTIARLWDIAMYSLVLVLFAWLPVLYAIADSLSHRASLRVTMAANWKAWMATYWEAIEE